MGRRGGVMRGRGSKCVMLILGMSELLGILAEVYQSIYYYRDSLRSRGSSPGGRRSPQRSAGGTPGRAAWLWGDGLPPVSKKREEQCEQCRIGGRSS